jgi:predicted lipid-binding transport protein (Tim44 family)
MKSYRHLLVIAATVCIACVAFMCFAPAALARVGGGQSYGGGSHGGGGGGGGGGAIIGIIRLLFILTINYPAIGVPLDLIIISYVVYRFVRRSAKEPEFCSNASSGIVPTETGSASQQSRRGGFAQEFNLLRRFDPNFSEIIFTDFCYALYARAQEARGRGAVALDQLSPYLSEEARKALLERNPPNLLGVTGIIVGAMRVADVQGLASPLVRISIEFETNYTEVLGRDGRESSEMTYYVRERWELERKRDVLSPTPQQAVALHCPRCGAPLDQMTNGVCGYCGTRIESGEFQWFVRRLLLSGREARGPLLTSDVPEVGTDYQTVIQPGFDGVRDSFQRANPLFSWGEFEARARLIFNELQSAWSTLQWERARPHETDNIFQMHRYWIEAYKRQRLRNILDQCSITAMQPVKLKEDNFYHAITLRIWAQGYDYTLDETGKVVSGSRTNLRRWSEYWTYIRSRNAKPAHARADLNCPNCGAALKVNATGICEFCGGKMTSGEFDWVLSKIEQDESYAG